MWTSTILHEPGGVPMVVQSIMNRHKFIQNPKIFCSIYRLLSKKWANYSLEEIGAQTITFGEYRNEGTVTCGFSVPQMKPVLLVDKAIDVKICLVREPYVSNITLIHKLQNSVREIIACIIGIHAQGLARLDLVGEHVKIVAHDTVRGHSSESSTRRNTAAVG
ncbi:hypothetical protein AVEN_219829-1 [Araneus ventricosus]|uniref:Uncharacterized protein n=1 Tax=Araneus ventricosus TaxID=182803 RepID=A0A4Y2JT92_ARAVE|nr:hypothetical protein AVEN_219829-1 [Araneus ventricosus]